MGGNVGLLPATAAAAYPDRPAVITSDGPTATWSQLEDRVAQAAGALRDIGVAPGTVVGVALPNGLPFAIAWWSALRAGATVVPLNPSYTLPELEHIVGDAGARLVLTDAAGISRTWPAGAGAVDVAALDGRRVADADTGNGDCAVICYTSGTTGRPKGALLSHDNLLANLEAFSDLPQLSLRPDDVLLGVLPFFHVFGLNVVLNAAARSGCGVLAVERFSPHAVVTAMAQHGVTVAYGAPPVFAALVGAARPDDLAALRAAVSGADTLPVPTWERFSDRFGVEIVEGYGLTETAPVLASNAAADFVVPGTVGVPLPGVRLQLRDPSGVEVATGEVGEITACGPNVFAGYHGQPEATAEVLHNRWFATGDLGSFDERGHLTIAGRIKDMVIVSGFNVYPREVEDALRSHPGVADAAVVGCPDERTGERVRAVVVPSHGALSRDEITGHLRERLTRYKLPRDVVLVDALPLLPSGKVDRRALVRAARSDADRA